MNRFHSRLALALAALLLALPGSVLRAGENPAITATTPTSDFVLDNVNGTAYHKKTGLTWKRCAEGQTWNASKLICDGLAFCGYNWSQALSLASGGWRLPNLKELLSIVERRNYQPAINTTVFPATSQTATFWSSSPDREGWTFYVSFQGGRFRFESNTGGDCVRLVRGGQFLPTHTLTVTRTGTGTITSNPAGIDCGVNCTATFSSGATITLTPSAGAGFSFTGWGGACSGSGPCVVTMDTAKSVSATFTASAIPTHTLTLNRTGTGTITSTPAGIDCGTTCAALFSAGAAVALNATAGVGYTFSGWGGACSGAGACTVTMNGDQAVTAQFVTAAETKYLLKVTRVTAGTVTSTPGGIVCGGKERACSGQFSTVTLTAAPIAGYGFRNWTGCPGSTGPTCTLTLSGPVTVKANFAILPKYALKVTKTSNGKITSTPRGLSCGYNVKACSARFVSGTAVTLTATPKPGKTFTGWTGACNGAGDCTVTMDGPKGVGAAFQ